MKKRVLGFFIASAVLASGAALCQAQTVKKPAAQRKKPDQAAKAPAQPPVPIKIKAGYPRLRVNLPQFIAKEEGLFEKHGLEVEMVPFETAQPMIQAQIAGQLDVAGYSALSIAYPASASAGYSLVFGGLMLEDAKHPFSMFIVPADSAKTSVADLKGASVGILPTVAFKEMLKAVLRKNSVPLDSVTIKNVTIPMQFPALESGSVQALFTTDPAATALISSGKGRLLEKARPSAPAAYLMTPYPFASATVTKKFLAENPEAVRRYFAALDEAVELLRADPGKGKMALKPYVTPELEKFLTKFPDSLYLKTGEAAASPRLFEAAAAEYEGWELLREKYDFKQDIYKGK